MRIYESIRNQGKLYFFCDGDRCDYFMFWLSGRYELNFAVGRVGDDTITAVLGLLVEIRGLAIDTGSLMEKVNDINGWRIGRKLLIISFYVRCDKISQWFGDCTTNVVSGFLFSL